MWRKHQLQLVPPDAELPTHDFVAQLEQNVDEPATCRRKQLRFNFRQPQHYRLGLL
jgi:hypothetical protein